MVKDIAGVKAHCVLTPEGLKWEENADPSSSVTPTGPPASGMQQDGKGGGGNRKHFCLPTALQNGFLPFLVLCGLLFDKRKLYIKKVTLVKKSIMTQFHFY